MKRCMICLEKKALSQFSKKYNTIDGLSKACIACNKPGRKKCSGVDAINALIDHNATIRRKFSNIKIGDIIRNCKVIYKDDTIISLQHTEYSHRKYSFHINDFMYGKAYIPS